MVSSCLYETIVHALLFEIWSLSIQKLHLLLEILHGVMKRNYKRKQKGREENSKKVLSITFLGPNNLPHKPSPEMMYSFHCRP